MALHSIKKGSNGYPDTNGAGVCQAETRSESGSMSMKFSERTTSARMGPFPPLAKAVHHKPLKADREGITAAFNQFGPLIHSPRKPKPTQAGEGTKSTRMTTTGLRVDRKYIGWKDVKTLLALIKSKIHPNEPVDDHTMLMERIIAMVAGLPSTSRTRVKLTNNFIDELWYSLDHPVLNFIGDNYAYRSADGSNNNPLFPQLGAAGMTYARSVRPTIMPKGALPDPALVFDSVMKRPANGYKKHPNNVSSILWYWATIITHDLFWTDFSDPDTSKTSSYLDLSPLYGSNQDMQNTIRTFHDGKLKPDAYADKRLNGMPPGVSVLLIMFNRFHNHVAEHLAAINEGGRFTRPPGPRPDFANPDSAPTTESCSQEDKARKKLIAAWKKYDEDLFQTARLVTSGLYINITLVDYVRNIVNLNRCDTTWTLDPRAEMGRDAGTSAGSEAGTGNVVSAEFNMCYRWHSCISEKDDRWIQSFYVELFGKSPTEVGIEDMKKGFVKFERSIDNDPGKRVFGGYQRDPKTGKFRDNDLVECITSAIEDCAGSFGARNIPLSMRPVEVLGIMRGRKWQLAGLNEFRRHFGLKPYGTFEELNSDPEVASCLRHLYEHPDFVELYPGIVAEEAKDPIAPGVGIAPTYTISRVVLSDAVCLVRGDRYYTTDYHPRSLTNWGYNEVQYDLNINHGCIFYKLFLRAFPNHFRNNSVYAHYPMVIPSENHRILSSLDRAGFFTWERPSYSPPAVEVNTYGGAKQGLDNPRNFKDVWQDGFGSIMGSSGGNKVVHLASRQHTTHMSGEKWEGVVKGFYGRIMDELMRGKSFVLGGARYVDVVRDVGNLASVHFVSRLFNLPLKTSLNPKGIYTEDELYAVLTLIYLTVFLDIDPVKSFPQRQATKTVAEQLGKLIEASVARGGDDPGGLRSHGVDMAKEATNKKGGVGLTNAEVSWGIILPTAVAFVPAQGTVFAQAVDYYLTEGKQHVAQIHQLARQGSSKTTDARLLGYALEGIRLSGLGVCRDAPLSDTIREDDGRSVHVQSGSRVFVSLASQATDKTRFPSPSAVDPTRPLENYLYPRLGPHSCLDRAVFLIALTEMFRAVFRKSNLRRTPGPQGELKKIAPRARAAAAAMESSSGGGGGDDGEQDGGNLSGSSSSSTFSGMYMTEDWSSVSPLPTSMRVCWDE